MPPQACPFHLLYMTIKLCSFFSGVSSGLRAYTMVILPPFPFFRSFLSIVVQLDPKTTQLDFYLTRSGRCRRAMFYSVLPPVTNPTGLSRVSIPFATGIVFPSSFFFLCSLPSCFLYTACGPLLYFIGYAAPPHTLSGPLRPPYSSQSPPVLYF